MRILRQHDDAGRRRINGVVRTLQSVRAELEVTATR
jgi:hypothetical protein